MNRNEENYLESLDYVLEYGEEKTDRTGTGTLSVFGYQMRFNLTEGFPAITTKKLAWKSVVSELLWFLEGSTDERRLAEILFNDDRRNLETKKTIWTANADNQGKILGHVNTKFRKELGNVYGKQWRDWNGIDQISEIINQIKTNPHSRRIILNAWNVSELSEMALPPCHCFSQFYVNSKNELSCQLYQRSGDAFLGIPFNIASYSLLIHMIAQVCEMKVGEFVHTVGDLHIYKNHIEQVKIQLSREPFESPEIYLNPMIKNIDNFTMDDIKLINYKSHESIKAIMAV